MVYAPVPFLIILFQIKGDLPTVDLPTLLSVESKQKQNDLIPRHSWHPNLESGLIYQLFFILLWAHELFILEKKKKKSCRQHESYVGSEFGPWAHWQATRQCFFHHNKNFQPNKPLSAEVVCLLSFGFQRYNISCVTSQTCWSAKYSPLKLLWPPVQHILPYTCHYWVL